MPVAEMLVESEVGYEYLSMLDGYSGYYQIYIVEEDVSKTTFRCPGDLGCYEWIMTPIKKCWCLLSKRNEFYVSRLYRKVYAG
jgi:hypothetical protein